MASIPCNSLLSHPCLYPVKLGIVIAIVPINPRKNMSAVVSCKFGRDNDFKTQP